MNKANRNLEFRLSGAPAESSHNLIINFILKFEYRNLIIKKHFKGSYDLPRFLLVKGFFGSNRSPRRGVEVSLITPY